MAKAATKAKPSGPELKSHIEIFDCEQGSEDWVNCRLGVVTASNFSKVLAGGEGKVRTRYMRDLAGELLTGSQAENYTNSAMERGKKDEPEAAAQYARQNFVELKRIGFVKNSGLIKSAAVGASPDYLIGDDGGLEIKSMIPALMIELFEKGAGLPNEHRAQVQGCMWVCERKWWAVKIFYPGMPNYTVKVLRDEAYIVNTLSPEIEKFNHELKRLVERIGGMGGKR